MTARLPFDSNALGELCWRHRIRRLSLFGSTLKGTAGPDSNVDLLVEFEVDAKPGLLDLATIENESSNLFGGRRVDLRTPEDLSRYSATKWFARRQFSMIPAASNSDS